MGVLDFFRRIIREDSVGNIVKEKLNSSEIENWIKNKRKENNLREKETLGVIEEKIKKFTGELKEKINVLKSVDIELKKEKENLKSVVNNSRKNYIQSLEKFLESLNHIEMNGFKESMEKINKIFLDFNKSSYKNYEITTILIGKEMGSIKGGLKVFSKELIKTFEDNKEIIDSFKKISLIESKLGLFQPIDKTLEKISETTSFLRENLNNEEKENKKLLEEIEKIKRSSNYVERLELIKKIESLKEELKNDIFGLRQILDFKALTNFFHINKEQMNILKDHKEDFQTKYRKDNGKMIIDLLNEAKLNNDKILEKVNSIRNKIDETSNYKKEIKEDETLKLYSQKKIIVLEINKLKIEKTKEEERDEKIRANKEELIDSLKQELDKMNVEVI